MTRSQPCHPTYALSAPHGPFAYDSVTLITTDGELTRKSLTQATEWFRDHHPETAVRNLAIEGLADLSDSDDYLHVEEGLYRAYFATLGHGLSLGEFLDLLRSVADRRIGIEIYPYANLQIKGFLLDAAAKGNPFA